MRTRRLLIALALAPLAGCTVSPEVQPYLAVDRPALDKVMADPASSEGLCASLLEKQASFDRDYDTYEAEYRQEMQKVISDKGISQAPVNGHYYVYNERVAAMAQAYFGLARARLAQGDYIRAERAAIAGARLADLRAWEPLVGMEADRERWQVMKEIADKSGSKRLIAVAGHNLELATDLLARPDPPDAHARYVALAAKAANDLKSQDDFIEQANDRRRTKVLGVLEAAFAAAGSAAQTYAETLQAQEGSITPEMRMLNKMNRQNIDTMFKEGMARAGNFADIGAAVYIFSSPGMVQALANPNAGVDPMRLISEFSERAKQVGKADHVLVQIADVTTRGANLLDKARRGGSADAIKGAMKEFAPAYEKLMNRMERGKEADLRRAGDRDRGGEAVQERGRDDDKGEEAGYRQETGEKGHGRDKKGGRDEYEE